MRVDCYNACECDVSTLTDGDTFYYRGELWIKVNATMSIAMSADECAIVALGDGMLTVVKGDTRVLLADTKVVVNTKDT